MQQTGGVHSIGTRASHEDNGEFDIACMRPGIESQLEAKRRLGIMSQHAKRQPVMSVLRQSRGGTHARMSTADAGARPRGRAHRQALSLGMDPRAVMSTTADDIAGKLKSLEAAFLIDYSVNREQPKEAEALSASLGPEKPQPRGSVMRRRDPINFSPWLFERDHLGNLLPSEEMTEGTPNDCMSLSGKIQATADERRAQPLRMTT
jgi:hypothetical protein